MELQTNTSFSYLKYGVILRDGYLSLELILSNRELCVLESVKAELKCVSFAIGEHNEVVVSFNC